MSTVKRDRLRADDLTQLSDVERIEELVRAINDISNDAGGAINRGLTILGNLRTQLFSGVEVVIPAAVADAFPLTLELGPQMPAQPTLVQVANIRNLTDPEATWTDAVQAFWTVAGDRKLSIRTITGLSSDTRYSVDFLVWS